MMSSLWLNDRRKNIYSQNGEDGVIEAIFERIGMTNRWCCDVGAHDGLTWSNVANLIFGADWSGVLIESDQEKFDELWKNVFAFKAVHRVVEIHQHVEVGMLDGILAKTSIPKDFDLLNIDVDGPDIQIWRNLKNYHPRVVIIEVDSLCEPGDGKASEQGMATIDEVVAVGKEKGYELALHTGNAIFVQRKLAGKLDVEVDRWQELFDRKWVLEQHG